jgi:hypothetical protein
VTWRFYRRRVNPDDRHDSDGFVRSILLLSALGGIWLLVSVACALWSELVG